MKAVLRVFGRLAAATVVATGLASFGGVVLVTGTTQVMAQAASNIVVRGNKRIDAETVRSYFRSAGSTDEAIRNLYGTGLFEDVRVSREGGRVVVTVIENAVINRVALEGNKKVKDEVLLSELQSKPRGPFSRAAVQADTQRILEIYRRQGRYEVKVEPKTISQPNGRVDLVFEINEGDKTKIQKIEFVGNNAFSAGRLRDVMTTTESNFLSWLKTSDIYDPDRLNADLELLRRFYLNRGYADFRVVSSVADLDRERNAFFITITVDEGDKYTYGTVDVESAVRDVDPAILRSKMKTRSGNTYSAEEVEKSVEAMSVELAKRGYAFAQVRPRGARDYTAKTISVIYSVEEGSRVYVERLNVRGNTRTRDYVVRREFDLGEGDAYNQALIERAERRLKNLGFFKNVRVSTEPGSAPDRVVVNVDVEDQATGEFSVAAGYSTADGIIGEVSVAERNFLGRGQYVKVSASFGQRTNGAEFSFTEPYFLGQRISAGFDLYYKNKDETKYSSYKIKTVGGGLRLGLPITEELTVGANYQIYQRDITIPDEFRNCTDPLASPQPRPPGFDCFADGEASVALKQAAGETLTSQIGYSLVWNNLDNINNPTRGLRAEFRQDLAGLGGDSYFIRSTGDLRYYYDLPSDFVAMFRGQGGHVTAWGGKDLRLIDQFFKGPDLVRGFAPSGIGPRDLSTAQRDPLGGTVYYGVSAELQFPIFGLPKEVGLKGALFADAGTLYNYDAPKNFAGFAPGACGTSVCPTDENKIRSSVGVSLLWASPLGPLRFDFAHVLSKATGDRTQVFRFSGGTRF